MKQLIFLFTFIVIVLTSCASADHNQPSQELLYEEQSDYFPINETMTLFPRWPNREFDTTLTIEGIGLTSSKDFFVVIHTQVTSAPDLLPEDQ